MNRQSIISSLYVDKDINQAIEKMQPVELQDDLRQEMFLVLCELEEERLINMHTEGWLRFFLVRTMLNMVKSDRSTFFKKFRQSVVEFNADHEKSQSDPEDIDTSNLTEICLTLHWYEREILFLYAETRNIVTLSKETKIPYRSLFKTITKAKQKVKQAMKSSQGSLIGNHITASLDIRVDIDGVKLNPEQISDIMADVSAYIRSKIAGQRYEDAVIQTVSDLRIKEIL